MKYVVAACHALAPEVFNGQARYRYKVFVQVLGWDLRAPEGLEFDQFDRPDTLYVVIPFAPSCSSHDGGRPSSRVDRD